MNTKRKGKNAIVFGIALLAALTLFSAPMAAFAADGNTAAKITEANAKEIALTTVGGGTVTKCGIENQNGNSVYDITVIYGDKKYEMNINTKTGELTNYTIQAIKPNGGSASSSSSSDGAQTSSKSITAAEAKQIALAKSGGGTVTKCESDYENGRSVYDITVLYGNKRYEMDVDKATGAVSDYKVKAIKQSGNAAASSASQPATGSAGITAAKAKQIALAEVGGGTVTKCKTDHEHGRLVYEIEIRYNGWEYELEIDTATGKIVKYEIDD